MEFVVELGVELRIYFEVICCGIRSGIELLYQECVQSFLTSRSTLLLLSVGRGESCGVTFIFYGYNRILALTDAIPSFTTDSTQLRCKPCEHFTKGSTPLRCKPCEYFTTDRPE